VDGSRIAPWILALTVGCAVGLLGTTCPGGDDDDDSSEPSTYPRTPAPP